MPALCRACDNCYLFIHSVAPNARYTATSQTLEASEFQTFPPLWMERLIYSRAHLGNPEPWEIGWIALLKAGSLGIWLSEAIIVPKNKILPPPVVLIHSATLMPPPRKTKALKSGGISMSIIAFPFSGPQQTG